MRERGSADFAVECQVVGDGRLASASASLGDIRGDAVAGAEVDLVRGLTLEGGVGHDGVVEELLLGLHPAAELLQRREVLDEAGSADER